MKTVGFVYRKKPEDKYISNWLKYHRTWLKLDFPGLPDFIKPDLTYQDIKVMSCRKDRDFYNLVVQKSELDKWFKLNILNKTELKFVCPDFKIHIISCIDYLNNIHKVYGESEPSEIKSGESFYLVHPYLLKWNNIGFELFNGNHFEIFEFLR